MAWRIVLAAVIWRVRAVDIVIGAIANISRIAPVAVVGIHIIRIAVAVVGIHVVGTVAVVGVDVVRPISAIVDVYGVAADIGIAVAELLWFVDL